MSGEGMSRFVRPETRTLTLANGDRLIVKTQLSYGEQQAMFARIYLPSSDGTLRVNPLLVGVATVVAYLVDWTVTDESGAIVPIRGLDAEAVIGVLNSLDPESVTEILSAIQVHESAMGQARREKKVATPTAPTSEVISISAG
jgi:hypothetical protein